MAESLLNLGGAIQNMIGLAQLGQMRERTALIQQDREIDKARLDLADKRYEQQLNQDQTQTFLRVAENPLYAHTPVGMSAIREVMRRNGSPITEEEAAVGFEAFVGLAKAKADRTMPQAEREKAAYKAMVFAPSLSRQFLESADKWEGMDARHQKIANELLLQEGKIRELNTKHVSALLSRGVYSTISGFMNQLVETTQVKDAQGTRALGPTFQKIMSSNDEKERTTLRHSVKDLDGKMQQQVLGLSASFNEFYTPANERLRPEVEAIKSALAQGREVDDADLGKVKALELLDASKEAVEKWAAQPYDKQAWTRLQNTMRQVNQAAAGSKKELSSLDGIRTGMLENATRRVNLAVDKEEAKQLAGEHLADLQQRFAELPEDQQSGQLAAKLIKESGYKDVKVEDVLQANPLKFKATKEVQIKDRTFTPEQAGRVSAMNRAIDELDQASDLLVKKDGSIDRGTLFSANTFGGLPFSKGRDVNRYIEDAVEAKLRLETGAAANRDEIKRIAARFKPSLKDADATIVGKLSQLRAFMQDSFNIIDPTGEVRGRIGGQAAGKPPSSPKTRFEQLKSQHPDWDQKRIYDQMIQEGY